jgi:hypothetical protein
MHPPTRRPPRRRGEVRVPEKVSMTVHAAQIGSGPSVGVGRDGLLRLALKLDAVASGGLGVLVALTAPMLQDLLGFPAWLLAPLGLVLVPYAAGVWLTGTRARVNRTAAWAVVGLNALWVVDSLAVAAAGWLPLTPLGVAFVLAQAAAVAFFAGLQIAGLRRLRTPTT